MAGRSPVRMSMACLAHLGDFVKDQRVAALDNIGHVRLLRDRKVWKAEAPTESLAHAGQAAVGRLPGG